MSLDREERVAFTGIVAIALVTIAWWALALWPVSDAPAWLARTRAACFGVNETGLPDAGGWIALTVGPFGMLLILIAGWRSSLRALFTKARVPMVLLVVLMLSAVSIAVARVRSIYTMSSFQPASSYASVDVAAPPLELIGHDGFLHTLRSLRGNVVVVSFVYGHCETVCPLVVHDVLTAQRSRHDVVALFVTLDPRRDTPSLLPSIARNWKLPDGKAWLLGGETRDVELVLKNWNVGYTRDEKTGDIIHASTAYIINREGRIAYETSGGSAEIGALLDKIN